MWLSILKSKLMAWLSAILSVAVMIYVIWTSSRRIQSAEVAAEGKIQDAQNRSDLAEELAATEVVARDAAHQEAKEKQYRLLIFQMH